MHDTYYSDKLYPLQDEILKLPVLQESIFYLTGGTALSRHYLHHRYSDDLDFFTNQHLDFKLETEKIITGLSKTLSVEISRTSESYVMLFIKKDGLSLKIDFVNDVPYRVDFPVSTNLFIRTDTWKNILSNKISALSRQEPKDVADIIYLCRQFAFQWTDCIEDARQKDTWVNELEVSRLLGTYPVNELQKVRWATPPSISTMSNELAIISKDILLGKGNSLLAE